MGKLLGDGVTHLGLGGDCDRSWDSGTTEQYRKHIPDAELT